MTNEERDLIAGYVARVSGKTPSGVAGSVPQAQPALPPIDPEADAFLAQQFQQHPEARYRITQTALVQEAALAEAQNRVQRLQWELDQARQTAQQAQQQGGQQRGFLGGLFGGGNAQQQRPGGAFGQGGPGSGGYGQQGAQNAPPPQQYPPNYQPGMFQRGGSGFLGSALTTAAGVAGGMVVGNALMNAFSGHSGALGGGGMESAAASPWGGEGMAASPWGEASGAGGAFDGGGVMPANAEGGYGQDIDSGDPFAGSGVAPDAGQDGGYDSPASWDAGGDAGFDGGGFDDI